MVDRQELWDDLALLSENVINPCLREVQNSVLQEPIGLFYDVAKSQDVVYVLEIQVTSVNCRPLLLKLVILYLSLKNSVFLIKLYLDLDVV